MREAAGHWGGESSSQKVTWMQWHHRESTSSYLQLEILEAGIKYLHLSLINKYQTVKYIYIICIMQLYFYHSILLAECTNHWLCCHDLFYRSETPSKGEPFICSLTSYGVYFTLQHITRVVRCSSVQETQTELCDSLVSSVILISVFLHLDTCHGPTSCSLMLCTVAAGGSPTDFTLLFSQRLLMTQVMVFTQLANKELRYTEV